MSRIAALLPVDGVHLESVVRFGDYTLHPGYWHGAAPDQTHPIYKLLMRQPEWFSSQPASYSDWKEPEEGDDASAYAILAFDLEVKDSLLALAQSGSHRERISLLQHLISVGDHALDVLRFQLCSYVRWEYIPGIAGQLKNGFSTAFFERIGANSAIERLHDIAGTVRAANNWLGLDLSDFESDSETLFLSQTVSGHRADDIALSIASCIRSAGQAYYTVHDEARFLALVFGVDGLCEPGKWRGWQQRTYIAALASRGDPKRFEQKLTDFQRLYRDVRNELVHGGVTFTTLALDARQACQDIHTILADCVAAAIEQGFTTHSAMKDYARSLMVTKPFDGAMRKVITADRVPTDMKDIPNWSKM